MQQAYSNAPLSINPGSMPTVNAPFTPLPQTTGSGTYSYAANSVYPTLCGAHYVSLPRDPDTTFSHARQQWTMTPQSAHWSGFSEPRPPNANAWLFENRGFPISPTSPVSSSSASSEWNPTLAILPAREMGTSATGKPTFLTAPPRQMVASPAGYCDTNTTTFTIGCITNTYTPVRDTLQFLNRPLNRKGDRPASREVVDTVHFSKQTVLGRIQETGNGLSAMQVLESIASLIEAEPLHSRAQTVSELRMQAVQYICGAFDALKRTGHSTRDTATGNDDSALLEARAEEAARLLTGLIELGVMRPGDLTVPVKIIFESNRRYLYIARALLEGAKYMSFSYTAVKWLQSMADDLQDAEDIKYIICQIKMPLRPYRH